MCRKNPPQSPPVTSASVWTKAEFDASSVNSHHAKPSPTISAPIRLSGRARHAYSPVPTKLHSTAGPKIAQTVLASWWSLVSATAIVTPPATRAASTTRTRARVEITAGHGSPRAIVELAPLTST